MLLALLGCEKDDICDPATLTTPRLVVEFFDYNATDQTKTVTNLQLTSAQSQDTLSYNGVSKIFLPLHTQAAQVNYKLTLNSNSSNPSLVFSDEIQIDYQSELVYVNRGCGYKAVFSFADTNAISLLEDADTDWIRAATVVQYAITNENETHIRLYF